VRQRRIRSGEIHDMGREEMEERGRGGWKVSESLGVGDERGRTERWGGAWRRGGRVNGG